MRSELCYLQSFGGRLKKSEAEKEHLKALLVDELMKGENPTAAAKKLGIAPGTAANWSKEPEIAEQLKIRRAKVSAEVDYTVAVAMREAEDAMAFAKETENANAYVKAVELRSKLQGLLVDRHDVRTQGLFQINIVGLNAPSARAPVQISSPKQVEALPSEILGKEALDAILPEILEKSKEEDDEVDIFS